MSGPVDLNVLPWQGRVLADHISPIIGSPAGLGAGKTRLLIEWVLHRGWVNAPVPSMLVEPTYGMVTDILLPQFEEIFEERKIRYRWVGPQGGGKKSSTITVIPGHGVPDYDILLRSADEPKRLDGKNLGVAGVDEAGQCKPGTIDRVRRRTRHPHAKIRQLFLTGTPENLGEYYDWCEGKPQPGTNLIRADTTENIYLPADYVATTLSHLDEEDREQYMRGRFITKGSRAYRAFMRSQHVIPCERIGQGRIHVGADFNVAKMSWVASIDRGNEECHVFDEIIGWDTTTEEQGELLSKRLQTRLQEETGRWFSHEEIRRRTTIHCDPSAKNRSTRAARSYVEQLRAQGYDVKCNHTTIPVKDRVSTVNARFKNGHLFVDPRCVLLIKALEQQQRGPDGEPQKDKNPKIDMSAETEALGYRLWSEPHWRASVPQGNNEVRVSGYLG